MEPTKAKNQAETASELRLKATVEAFCGCIRLCAAERLASGELEGWDSPDGEKAFRAGLKRSLKALAGGREADHSVCMRAAVDLMILWWNRLAN